jgi:GR25 family glycosyltransferase involved in LPS biosynthesis
MECVYINLDGEDARRAALEANFSAHQPPGWTLTRLRAATPADAAKIALPGRVREVEKAVYLSHLQALEQTLAAPGHVLILEDDALFGPQSCERIASACAAFPEQDWDMIFTDVTLVDPYAMTRFFSMRRELARSGREMLVPLREFTFAGTTSYVVNRRFRARWLAMLRAQSPLDLPLDLYMRSKVAGGEVRAYVTFPFVTSLSSFGDASQHQPRESETADLVWNAFRRLTWLHRDIDAAIAPLRRLEADFVDPEARAFTALLGAALSDRFVVK